MIEGTITEDFAAVVPIVLQVGDETLTVMATLDTGFDDYLSLPYRVVEVLSLPFVSKAEVTLADGSILETVYHRAEVLWDGARRPVLVLVTENKPLIGMRLLADCAVRFVVRPGAVVYIDRPMSPAFQHP